ncbi:MAG: Gfo/Idh/MocA family oxidoreductase [Anaerostipes sp.]|nr:Gfo/Idh/MocA family oxidoreductase [Anaerostipes sp.]
MADLKWGIMGCGGIAGEMAEALEKHGKKAYAVCGRTKSKAETFAMKHKIHKIYETYQELLGDQEIDIIYIATPHGVHYENIKDALNAGKHVLCEKAITVNDHQLEEVVELAKSKDLILREAMTISHMPLFKKLKDRIKEGAIGEVKMVQVNFGSNKGKDYTNRFYAMEAAGGALLDIGGYATTFARTFLDETPNTILTTMKYAQTGVDEQCGIIMKNSLEQMVVMSLTIQAKQPKRGVVTGDEGYIEVYEYPRAMKGTITNTATGKVEIVEAGKTEDALLYEVEAMEGTIAGIYEDNAMEISRDVMHILSSVRNQWGMKYPFE